MKTLLICLMAAGALAASGYVPRVVMKAKSLETVIDAMPAWGMETFYTPAEIRKYQMSGYTIEGNSPCTAFDPTIILSHIFTYRYDSFIIDFAVAGSVAYYMTSDKVLSRTLVWPYVFTGTGPTELLSLPKHNFTYFDAFLMPGGDTLLFFKGADPTFSYATLEANQTVLSQIRPMPSDFSEFSEEMRIAVYKTLIFIPAGPQGVYQYEYSTAEHTLKLSGLLSIDAAEGAQDIRDVTVRPFAGSKELLMIVADYNRGVVMARLDPVSRTVTYLKSLLEFVKAKSVSWTAKDGVNKLIVIADGLGSISKLIVLTFRFNSDSVEVEYDRIKVLDGQAQYGDANDQYAAVLMANSVLVTKLLDRHTNIITYLNNPGIRHAKLYRPNGGRGGNWLLYTRGVEFVATFMSATNGFLMCNAGSNDQTYSFQLLGRSTVCGVDTQNSTIRECDYVVDVSLRVAAQTFDEEWDSVKAAVFAVSAVCAIVVLFLLISLVVVAVRYRRARVSLNRYEQLGGSHVSNINSPPGEPAPSVKTDPPVSLDEEKGVAGDSKDKREVVSGDDNTKKK